MIAFARPALALLITALLAACATEPTAPPIIIADASESEMQRWVEHQEQVGALPQWDARGKVAFRLPDEAGSANLLWQHRSGNDRVRLSGPLGTNAVSLRSDGVLLYVTRDGIERSYPADAAPWLGDGRLLPIPLSAIQHWLLGIPAPDTPLEALETSDGLARTLEQAGWRVEYGKYREAGDTVLPSELTVHADAVSLRLRVLIRDWELTETAP